MGTWRRMHLGGFLITLLLAAGCVADKQPVMEIDPFASPPPRTGPASVSGTLTITAPVMKVASSPVETASDVQYAWFDYIANLGVFPVTSEWPDRTLYSSWTGYTSMRLSTGIYSLAYDFSNIPIDRYELRVFDIQQPDWPVGIYEEFFRSEEFSLSEEQPILRNHDCSWNLTGRNGSGTLKGKIFISGNPPFGCSSWTSLSPEDYDSSIYLYDSEGYGGTLPFHLNWNVPTRSAQYGRLFYEISGLSLEQYSADREGPFVELGPANTTGELDFYEHTFNTNHSFRISGVITVNLSLANIEPWPGDLVLETVRDGEITSAFHRHVRHLDPTYWLRYWYDSGQVCELRYLEAGPYMIRMLKLGATDMDTPEIIAELPEPVVLEIPEPIVHEHQGNVWYEYPSPELEVDLSVDLAVLQD